MTAASPAQTTTTRARRTSPLTPFTLTSPPAAGAKMSITDRIMRRTRRGHQPLGTPRTWSRRRSGGAASVPSALRRRPADRRRAGFVVADARFHHPDAVCGLTDCGETTEPEESRAKETGPEG